MLPSGKRLQFAIVKIAIEIVDLPIKHGDFPQFFVCLPEGTNGNADFVDGFLKILLMEML